MAVAFDWLLKRYRRQDFIDAEETYLEETFSMGKTADYPYGPTLCRVERTYVDNKLIRVTLEPITPEDTVELGKTAEFVTVMSLVPLTPLSIWPKQEGASYDGDSNSR